MSAQPAWHPDPYGEACHRWWDGAAWTDDLGPAEPQFGLQPLRDAAGRPLVLDQSTGSGTDELRDETGLRFGLMQKPWVGDVTIYTERGIWLLDRQGITQNALSIRVQPANVEIARFQWQGIGTGTDGRVIFYDGRWFDFLRGEEMQRRRLPGPGHEFAISEGSWTFLDHGGAAIATTRLAWPEGGTWRTGTGRTTSNVVSDIYTDASKRREIPLLAMLGVYLVWWTVSLREEVSRD